MITRTQRCQRRRPGRAWWAPLVLQHKPTPIINALHLLDDDNDAHLIKSRIRFVEPLLLVVGSHGRQGAARDVGVVDSGGGRHLCVVEVMDEGAEAGQHRSRRRVCLRVRHYLLTTRRH